MPHLLIIELPGGNDADIVAAAVDRGDAFTFLSADLAHYRRQPQVWAHLAAARQLVEVPGFTTGEVERRVRAVHAALRIDAVLCLIEIRLVEAARLARMLGLRFLQPDSAALLRDKFNVRQRLLERGLPQPEFALATSNAELRRAVQALGLPVLIKPADGYGSQNIVVLRHPEDLDPLLTPLHDLLPSRADYGLGVHANDRLLVERYMRGRFIGCDTFSSDGRHRLLGVHDKLMFELPSFALRGSTFVPRADAHEALEREVFALLDAVGFDHGATHMELILTPDGPRLVEINARLVGARIPRLLGMALGRSLHADLIALHAGQAPPAHAGASPRVAVLRWLAADRAGVLDEVVLPPWTDPAVRGVEILVQRGQRVQPPMENADRLGFVMVCGPGREEAEELAERYVAETRVVLRAPTPPRPAASARLEFVACPSPRPGAGVDPSARSFACHTTPHRLPESSKAEP